MTDKVKQVLKNGDVLLMEDGSVTQVSKITNMQTGMTATQLILVSMDQGVTLSVDLSKIEVLKK